MIQIQTEVFVCRVLYASQTKTLEKHIVTALLVLLVFPSSKHFLMAIFQQHWLKFGTKNTCWKDFLNNFTQMFSMVRQCAECMFDPVQFNQGHGHIFFLE